MGTIRAPFVADLLLDSRNHENRAVVTESFDSTSRYLDDLFEH